MHVPYCVVTFHPVTLEKEASENELYELIEALRAFSDYSYIITLSNTDSGGDRINEIWRSTAQKYTNFHVVPSLGMKRYLTALKYSEMMIGRDLPCTFQQLILATDKKDVSLLTVSYIVTRGKMIS